MVMMQKRLLAAVHVDKAVFHFDKAFDYLVPEELHTTLQRGCRVLVPFGNGNRARQGMVMNLHSMEEVLPSGKKPPSFKPILAQIDREPIFDEEMFAMADFMVNQTFCTYYDAVKTILPNAYGMQVTETYRLVRRFDEEELQDFTYEERNLIAFLQNAKTQRELDEFLNCTGNLVKKPVVDALLAKGVIQKQEQLKQKVSDKTIQMVRLSERFLMLADELKLTPKQREVVDFLMGVGAATKREIMYFCAVGEGVIKKLGQKSIVEYYEREVFRTPELPVGERESLSDLVLSDEQQTVYDGLCSLMAQGKPQVALLHGVTGSGKTSVFIKLIEQTVQQGKQALMLVPEISLTPQIVQRFKSLFGEQVAVMHSSLSLGERLDEYKRMKQGKASIVVGTRSAVFAPFDRIGLVILDEEGEASYKSDSAPRYHAREIAKLRILRHNAVLLLASATPSVESYYKAKTGVYRLFELHERYANATLPEVYIVDRKDEEKNANTTSVSTLLQQEITKNLARGEQTILFINRRGYNTIACCLACGEVVKCPKCDVPLTYHKDNGYLMCHYCGHARKFRRECPSCHSEHLKLSGQGTQKIEDELAGLFPTARILRMDTDTTYSRYAYSEKFDAFRRGDYDLLIGTQMIAKGLDFPNVTLVGVLDADAGLYANDYRGVERVFSLITQVVGRSGRAEKTGRAYIQTYLPDNPVLRFAAEQNYTAFYEDEIVSRKALLYPPYCDICVVSLAGLREEHVTAAAEAFLSLMKQSLSGYENRLAFKVIGPIKPAIYRLNGKYRQKILIKCRCNAVFRSYLRTCLLGTSKDKRFRNITVYVDVNGDINN